MNTTKTHRLEAPTHRIERPEHPPHHAGIATHWRPLTVMRARSRSMPLTALRSALELRYQVYCVECRFLSPDDYPDGAESDEHDATAEHFFAFDAEDELVGYVRLVRPNAEQRFPFQNHCPIFADEAGLPVPGRAAEISRLMLRVDYRRLRHLQDLPELGLPHLPCEHPRAGNSGDRRDKAAQVLLSLYRQVYLYSRAHGIDHWYAAMERPLARSLMRMSIAFRAIGPQTDYYGPVAPYLANLNAVESRVAARNPTLLQWLRHPSRQPTSPSHAIDFEYT